MSELDQIKAERPKRFRLDWIVPVIVRPRQAFAAIAAETNGVWLAPILILIASGSIRAIISGVLTARSGAAGVGTGLAFTVIFPLLQSVAGVLVSWLLVSSAIHLTLTLQGGRSSASVMSNIVAWAALPFVIRDLLRIVAMLIAGQPIMAAGLSGFVPADAVGGVLFLKQLLLLIDIYLIWHIVLLVIGVKKADPGLEASRLTLSLTLLMLFLMLIRAAVGFGWASLGSLSVSQPYPFFF